MTIMRFIGRFFPRMDPMAKTIVLAYLYVIAGFRALHGEYSNL
ncbi:hypothetical protein [Niallia sp. Krafla_26]